jgi:hypothetical protein
MQRRFALAELLSAKPFVEQLRGLVQGSARLTQVQEAICELGNFASALTDYHGRRLLDAGLSNCFQEHLLSALPRPLPVTLADLMDTAAATFLQRDANFDEAFERFRQVIVDTVTVPRRTSPFPILSGYFVLHDVWEGTPTGAPAFQPELWEDAERRFRLILAGTVPTSGEVAEEQFERLTFAPRVVYVRAEATCTRRALRAFRRDVKRVLRTILKSLEMLRSFEDPMKEGCAPRAPVWLTGGPSRYPVDGEEEIINDGWAIHQLLDAFFAKSQKKDSMDRRLRNALHLLVESDQQHHTGIALALSMSAIESLLCRQGSDIANQVAENSATLLEPEARRRADAVKFVKRLYDARSRTLHGELLEHELTLRRDARVLASAILVGILERRVYQAKAGVDSETPDALLGELRDSKYGDGEVPGVTPLPVRRMWREHT